MVLCPFEDGDFYKLMFPLARINFLKFPRRKRILEVPSEEANPGRMTLASASRRTQKFKIWRKNLDSVNNSTCPRYEHFISELKSCTKSFEVSQIHGYMVKTGLDHDSYALSKLLASSVLDIKYAASIFKHIENPNLFNFNTMIRGYSISDDPKEGFGVFNKMRAEGFILDQFSFVTTLKSCARELAIDTGQGIHGIVERSGHLFFINVKNTLLNLYCVCGRIKDAHKLFDEFPPGNDLVSWNTLMNGCLLVSQPNVVVDLFRTMYKSGFRPSVATLLSVLSATGDLGSSFRGESLHGHCTKIGLLSDLNVVTALIGMYAKTGHIHLGRRIFDGINGKDVILWNCMVDKYAKNGLLEESVALLQLMKHEQMKPNSSTLVGLLSACAASGATSLGRCVGDYVEEEELALDLNLGTALIHMYAKFGYLDKAVYIFERMDGKDVKSWTAMVSGYGAHGLAENAIALFYRMEEEGIRPNEVTFLAVLSACSHGGLVPEGMRCFERMVQEYGFMPKVEHYGCVIDLLGRAGLLEEAHDLMRTLPIKSDSTAWRALLAACRVYGNVTLGEQVWRRLAELGDEHPTDSILLSGTHAIAGRLPDQTMVQEEKTCKEAENRSVSKKEAGCSSIEMDNWGLDLAGNT